MTSPSRVFAILDLFSREQPLWHTDEINETLGYTRATGYRYVKELVEVGLLQRLSSGRYALGPRIIELDHQLRQTDPVLLAAVPAMEALAHQSGFDTVLSVLFPGPKVIDVHRVNVQKALKLAYGRGRPRPLFRSGSPKILLSGLPRAQMLRIYNDHAAEIQSNGMGESWKDFRRNLADIRKSAFYFSIGELEPSIGAAVVPITTPDGNIAAALALVGKAPKLRKAGAGLLHRHLKKAAARIEAGLRSNKSH